VLTVFVIAFIACAHERCQVSYPDLNRYYASYDDCTASVKGIGGYSSSFDATKMLGTEIVCLEQSITVETWRASETTSVRSGPSEAHKIIGTIRKGRTFFVIGRDGKWLKTLTEDGHIGYFFELRAKKAQ
jgi:uncharacterized protein YgiM (DUF1202 family)